MTAVNVTSVNVLNNPNTFFAPLQFEISYECHCELQHDLEWKLTYVGLAESEKYDQELDSVLVGPVAAGQFRFVFQADAPDHAKLPPADIVGVTVLLLTCSYKDQEFIRVGYYVSNEYTEEELREAPPEVPLLDKLTRVILADSPRVTRFPCDFDKPAPIPVAGQDNSDGQAMASGMSEEDLQRIEQYNLMAQEQAMGQEDGGVEEEEDGEDEGEQAEEEDITMEEQ